MHDLFHPYERPFTPREEQIILMSFSDEEAQKQNRLRQLRALQELLGDKPSHKVEKSSVPKDAHITNVDVNHFQPEEIVVKVTDDDFIAVECVHAERADEHGTIMRKFMRKFKAPEGYDLDGIVSKLSSDGVLTIAIPKKVVARPVAREIPIIYTGKPSANRAKNYQDGDNNSNK